MQPPRSAMDRDRQKSRFPVLGLIFFISFGPSLVLRHRHKEAFLDEDTPSRIWFMEIPFVASLVFPYGTGFLARGMMLRTTPVSCLIPLTTQTTNNHELVFDSKTTERPRPLLIRLEVEG
jgi:hypothetical protein